MRAMVLEASRSIEQNPLQLKKLDVPSPNRRQVRVRVSCCGLCHTDLHTVEGDLPLPLLPVVPGHQIVGTVDAIGDQVRDLRVGDRVGIPWLHWTCGECRYCRGGSENLCDRAQFTGYHVNGGYAESVLAPEDFVLELPPSFSDEHAAPLLCGGIIGYRALRLSNVQPGEKLGLFGFGSSAHIVLQIARHVGNEVYVFSRSAHHRKLAAEMGAVWVGSGEDQLKEELDSAIIFAPAGTLVPIALRRLRKGGTLALAGITMTAIPEMQYSLLYHERTIRTVANSTRRDAREFLELAAQANVRTEIETFPLQDANLALRSLKESKLNAAGVLKVSAA
jgi:propanol-preferring alcohol dehydrogenase